MNKITSIILNLIINKLLGLIIKTKKTNKNNKHIINVLSNKNQI